MTQAPCAQRAPSRPRTVAHAFQKYSKDASHGGPLRKPRWASRTRVLAGWPATGSSVTSTQVGIGRALRTATGTGGGPLAPGGATALRLRDTNGTTRRDR